MRAIYRCLRILILCLLCFTVFIPMFLVPYRLKHISNGEFCFVLVLVCFSCILFSSLVESDYVLIWCIYFGAASRDYGEDLSIIV